MSEEARPAPQPSRGEQHPAAAALNPEQHLQDAHKLSIQLQGKVGPTGRGTWALVREDRGKSKTLTVFEGTRREAAARFYDYIHPNKGAAPAPAARRSAAPQRPGPRPQAPSRRR